MLRIRWGESDMLPRFGWRCQAVFWQEHRSPRVHVCEVVALLRTSGSVQPAKDGSGSLRSPEWLIRPLYSSDEDALGRPRPLREPPQPFNGVEQGTRTLTTRRSGDFESPVYASSNQLDSYTKNVSYLKGGFLDGKRVF